MCFRPATPSAPKECPECKKVIPTIAGMSAPSECPSCGAKLVSDSSSLQAAPVAPPKSPSVPQEK